MKGRYDSDIIEDDYASKYLKNVRSGWGQFLKIVSTPLVVSYRTARDSLRDLLTSTPSISGTLNSVDGLE